MQGGVGAYTQILARTFSDRGHQVFIFGPMEAVESRSEIHLTSDARRWQPRTMQAIRAWAQQNHLDIINLQFETAAFRMSPWIHFLPAFVGTVPVVTTFHDLLVPYLFPKAGKLREWILMKLARTSQGVITTNHEDMERIKNLENTALIPIGSNILTELPTDYDRHQWRKRFEVDSGDFLITHFGFLNRSKGVETLLKALAEMYLNHMPVKLLMIGGRVGSSDPSNESYAREIDGLINRLGIVPIVSWTGFVTEQDVTGYLKAADAVVLPYRDGASYRRGSLMAAIQHGCVIVTTQPQVNVPTFQHGENMLIFPVDDTVSLINNLKQLIDQKPLRRTLQQHALETADCFRWDTIAHDYEKFFEHILA